MVSLLVETKTGVMLGKKKSGGKKLNQVHDSE